MFSKTSTITACTTEFGPSIRVDKSISPCLMSSRKENRFNHRQIDVQLKKSKILLLQRFFGSCMVTHPKRQPGSMNRLDNALHDSMGTVSDSSLKYENSFPGNTFSSKNS